MSDSTGGSPWADDVPPTIQQPGVPSAPPPTPPGGQPPTGGGGVPPAGGVPPGGPGDPPVYPPAKGEPPKPAWYKQPWPYAIGAAVILLGSVITFFAVRDDESGSTAPTTLPTTIVATTVGPTTVAPTTLAPTTVAPTTTVPATTTTVAPTTTEATTTTAPPPTTTTLPPFTDGTRPVGTGAGDVRPGRYVAPTGTGSDCTWQRLSSQTGPGNVLGEGALKGAGQAIAEVVASDKFFTSAGCGTWTGYEPPAKLLTSIQDGQFVVGAEGTGEIAAGGWKTAGGADCTWARLKAFTGDADDVIASGTADQATTVQLAPTDVGFSSAGCDSGWTPA